MKYKNKNDYTLTKYTKKLMNIQNLRVNQDFENENEKYMDMARKDIAISEVIADLRIPSFCNDGIIYYENPFSVEKKRRCLVQDNKLFDPSNGKFYDSIDLICLFTNVSSQLFAARFLCQNYLQMEVGLIHYKRDFSSRKKTNSQLDLDL